VSEAKQSSDLKKGLVRFVAFAPRDESRLNIIFPSAIQVTILHARHLMESM